MYIFNLQVKFDLMQSNMPRYTIIMSKFVSTVCYIGYSKYMPGTIGTLFAFVVSVLFKTNYDTSLIIAFLTFIVGVYYSTLYSIFTNNKDPKEVVIDELSGYFLTLGLNLFTIDSQYINITIMSFITFRIFDILKPWPISYIDRRTKSGIGIMLDDIIAGIMASFLSQIFFFLIS